eukprot:UN23910
MFHFSILLTGAEELVKIPIKFFSNAPYYALIHEVKRVGQASDPMMSSVDMEQSVVVTPRSKRKVSYWRWNIINLLNLLKSSKTGYLKRKRRKTQILTRKRTLTRKNSPRTTMKQKSRNYKLFKPKTVNI